MTPYISLSNCPSTNPRNQQFTCFTEQNKCHPNPCRNGGSCTGTMEAEGFECTCREGFKGKNCEGKEKTRKEHATDEHIKEPLLVC